MRFGNLHSMTPAQRMEVLEAQFPSGTRRSLFDQCGNGEYERLLRGIPSARLRAWSNTMTPGDREAWKTYNRRTAAHRAREQAVLDLLAPKLSGVLSKYPYDLEELLALPRLLGDPVDTAGVRLYFRREAFGGAAGVFERVIAVSDLVQKLERLQRWGAAPFVALHDIPYGEPRTNTNVRRARVFSVDWDVKHDQHPPIDLIAEYAPDLFVRTGGGYHAYWALTEEESAAMTLTEWRRTGLALCRALNGDEDAVLGSQLMRLPGSVHLKNPGEPKPVYVVSQRIEPVRQGLVAGLTRAFKLKPRDEDVFQANPRSRTIDIDPEEHPALAHLLCELEEQGLCPEQTNRGWQYYCPVHEVDRVFGADLEEGATQVCVPRTGSTPSGILRVNEDKSLALFCGSTQRCGAGPRDILERLGLSTDLTWLECGGFLQSDYGKRWKAARIADGTWKGGRSAPRSSDTVTVPAETQERWNKMTGI